MVQVSTKLFSQGVNLAWSSSSEKKKSNAHLEEQLLGKE